MTKRLLILAVEFYRKFISPALPGRCRFYPTCSAYAVESIRTRGALRGLFKSVIRILKCHPLHPGGYDPVHKE
jgi:putative membrane protein insertion efficiency factor